MLAKDRFEKRISNVARSEIPVRSVLKFREIHASQKTVEGVPRASRISFASLPNASVAAAVVWRSDRVVSYPEDLFFNTTCSKSCLEFEYLQLGHVQSWND